MGQNRDPKKDGNQETRSEIIALVREENSQSAKSPLKKTPQPPQYQSQFAAMMARFADQLDHEIEYFMNL